MLILWLRMLALQHNSLFFQNPNFPSCLIKDSINFDYIRVLLLKKSLGKLSTILGRLREYAVT